MPKKSTLFFQLEIVWWLITATISFAVLYPITSEITGYPFLLINLIFIIVFITFGRYLFLLKHSFIAQKQVVKIVLFFLCIPLVAYLVSNLHYFQTFLDEKGALLFLGELSFERRIQLEKFIRTEMILFGVGSIIVAILFPLRLLISVWRYKNRGTV